MDSSPDHMPGRKLISLSVCVIKNVSKRKGMKKMMSKLGFGTLRLERNTDKSISLPICKAMLDTFLAGGGKYIEVAYAYSGTEKAIGELLKEYSRDRFILTDKMPMNGKLL